MDPNEIIKHAPDLMKGGAALAGALKFTDVVKAILGPATAEIAERIHDEVRLYRFGRQLECLKKAEKMATDAGFTPKAVPIKLLFPLLEGASLEENEDLHTMWAALLANAASPENSETVRPSFIAILKQMAPDEAALLNWMRDELPERAWKIAMPYQELETAYTTLLGSLEPIGRRDRLLGDPRLRSCVSSLEAMRLIELVPDSEKYVPGYWFTSYGFEFIEACSPPKPKS